MKILYHYTSGIHNKLGPHKNITNTYNIWGNCTGITGSAHNLIGDVSGLIGSVTGLSGDATDVAVYFRNSIFVGEVTRLVNIHPTATYKPIVEIN
jgi:hypothetical protein